MKLDIRPLLAGERLLSFDYELTLDTYENDPKSFLFGVGFPSPMKVMGQITNTAGYMRMQLTASVNYQAECARCLRPVTGSFSIDLEKTVATKDMLGDIDEDKLDDFALVEDGFLDMDEPVLCQLEMEFPVRFLCDEDCLGLCQHCGKNLNDGPCNCKKNEIDPRLEPLRALYERLKNEEDNNN